VSAHRNGVRGEGNRPGDSCWPPLVGNYSPSSAGPGGADQTRMQITSATTPPGGYSRHARVRSAPSPLSFLSAHCLVQTPTQAGGRKKRKRTKKTTRVLRPCAWARVRALHFSGNATPAAIAATHGCAPPRHPFSFLSAHCLVQSQPRQVAEKKDPRPSPLRVGESSSASLQRQRHPGGYSRHARVRSTLSPPFVSFGPLPWIRTNPGRWPKKTEEDEKNDPHPSRLRVGESSNASRQLQRTSAAIAATHRCTAPYHPLSFLSAHCLGSEPTQAGGRKKRKRTKKRPACFVPARGREFERFTSAATHLGGYSRHAPVHCALSPLFVSFGPLLGPNPNPGRWPKTAPIRYPMIWVY
jgi:hypothetical protein